MTEQRSHIPYPSIADHGVIGDRRTAALVASDGTLNWLCLPRYDGAPVFGALLDDDSGGFWRLGPATVSSGQQRYLEDTTAVITSWSDGKGKLELTDIMAWPLFPRANGRSGRRIILRRLRASRTDFECTLEMRPRLDFAAPPAIRRSGNHMICDLGEASFSFWASLPLEYDEHGARALFRLRAGEEVWAVLDTGIENNGWDRSQAIRAFEETISYWRSWASDLSYRGERRDEVCRSAMTVHLLGYAPGGSMVAAPTTSLPERIGGDRNYDYRYAWVRDASLSMAALALLGDTRDARKYMEWLSNLDSATDSPLQVVYRIDGGTDLTQIEMNDIAGYRESLPVRIGNHAAEQRQLDSLGYFVDCAFIYLSQGGEWNERYWDVIREAANYTQRYWREPDRGIWELDTSEHFVSSKVMSWVALERATRIARHTGRKESTAEWEATMEEIHAEVMECGLSDAAGSFRQRYGSDALDASVLLIPVMGFLAPDHPRVTATIEAVEERLTLNNLVHRFIAAETPGHGTLPLGEFEGAFLPCTFWLATSHAMRGDIDRARELLQNIEAAAGDLCLFAEEMDARSGMFLGNTPLLFSQVEYVRAVLQIESHATRKHDSAPATARQ
jgi:GH15 family glucan-1,4-alpha-glucosidase